MKSKRRYLIVGASALALAAGAAGATAAIGNDEEGGAASGSAADKARDKALALYPGSEANAVERDSEKGATWEVEITRADGKTVDVRLDANYNKVVAEVDHEDANGK